MGIQLDWQIESERQQRQSTEDPSARRQRRQQQKRLLIVIALIVCVLGGAVAAIVWRLNDVNNRYRQDLLDTVDAEIRAIKVGDRGDFMAIRRSGSEYWMSLQPRIFDEYQTLKQQGQLELPGTVLDIEMDLDNSRARVLVEERIGDETFMVAWFYWLYADDDLSGWRRVPPDVDFWGEARSINQNGVQIEYFHLDEALAAAVIEELSSWWAVGCEALQCASPLPELNIQIEARTSVDPRWDPSDQWVLTIGSPLYQDRVSLDNPFNEQLRQDVAALIAERIVTYAAGPKANLDIPLQQRNVNAYVDGQWLASEFQNWLIDMFFERQEPSFINSMSTLHGSGAVGLMLRLLSTDVPLGAVIESATGASLDIYGIESLNAIRWHEYFAWRLTFETDLLRGVFPLDEQSRVVYHNALYDERDANAMAAAANRRVSFNPSQAKPTIQSANISLDGLGQPVATIVVAFEDRPPEEYHFRWVEATWKRID